MKITSPPAARLWLLGLALLGASVAGAGWVLHSHADEGRDRPSGREPTGKTPPSQVVCFGHVDVEDGVAALSPLQPGRVDKVHVKEGQDVKAGIVLLNLDRRQAQYLAAQAEADLESAQIQLDQAQKLIAQQQIKESQQQAAIDAARSRIKAMGLVISRMEDLRNIQTNEKELEAARAKREELRAALRAEEQKFLELKLNDPRQDIRRAEADVTAKQARLDQARLGLEECDLKAPVDGTVLRLFVSAGDVFGPQSRQPAVFFCPRGPRIIRAEVEQEFADRVAVGQPTSIQDDTRAGTAWKGRVLRLSDWYTHRRSILQDPLQLNDVRTLECLIAVDPGQAPLRIGQRVRVTIGPGQGTPGT
jgi:multidrug resistance efflux pump